MKRYEHRIDSAIGLAKIYEADWKRILRKMLISILKN